MKYITILYSLLCFCALHSQAQETIVVNGTTRNYLKYVPENLGSKRPLLISCHGMNQDAAYQKNMLLVESVADTAKFVTVFPNGINKSWDISGQSDIEFIKALITKMKQQYDIDETRVYLSGFSMGGMFTYHAMNYIADKIAAFAPISGYPLYGSAVYTSSRPVPIIHTHGTGDDVVVFSGLQTVLDGWIKRDGCSTTATVTKNYRGYSHVTRHLWNGGAEGTKIVLMELANKGHWVSNDGLKTVDEIWKFCKNYSLEPNPVTVGLTNLVDGATTSEHITVTAEATSEKDNISYVSFYLNGGLVKKVTIPPYECELSNLKEGTNTLQVLAVDASNNRNASKISFTVQNGYLDPATGVSNVASEGNPAATRIYNIHGQKVSSMKRGGIYIVNGKTMVI